MPVRKRGNGWEIDFSVARPGKSRKRVRRMAPRGATKRQAEALEREWRDVVLTSMPSDGGRRFDDFSEEWLRRYTTAAELKHSTVVSYQYIMREHLVPYFGKYRLGEIGEAEIAAFKEQQLGTRLSKKSIRNQIGCLQKMLATAKEWGLISRVPRPPRSRRKGEQQSIRFLGFDEAQRLIAASRAEPEWACMVLVALHAGLRLGELLALRWADVYFDSRKLIVRRSRTLGRDSGTKNERGREVPLTDSAWKALKAHGHLRGERVFCREDGSPWSTNQAYWPLWRFCKAAGLEKCGWHTLRHTFASHLVMRGQPLKAVQELLGHQSIEMTLRYSHLSPEAKTDAVAVLDQVPEHGIKPAQ